MTVFFTKTLHMNTCNHWISMISVVFLYYQFFNASTLESFMSMDIMYCISHKSKIDFKCYTSKNFCFHLLWNSRSNPSMIIVITDVFISVYIKTWFYFLITLYIYLFAVLLFTCQVGIYVLFVTFLFYWCSISDCAQFYLDWMIFVFLLLNAIKFITNMFCTSKTTIVYIYVFIHRINVFCGKIITYYLNHSRMKQVHLTENYNSTPVFHFLER